MAESNELPAVLKSNTIMQPAGEEPPSGYQGKGTAGSPYDQGNAPEAAAGPGIEPPSGQQGEGTVNSPYDQGNQPENKAASQSPHTPALPSINDPLSSPTNTHQGSADLSEPNKEQTEVIAEHRGRDETSQRTTSTLLTPPTSSGTASKGGNFDASKPGAGQEAERLRRIERSVSPGQLDDGTHVQCSGDKGKNYAPGNKMDKLKERFHFGKRH